MNYTCILFKLQCMYKRWNIFCKSPINFSKKELSKWWHKLSLYNLSTKCLNCISLNLINYKLLKITYNQFFLQFSLERILIENFRLNISQSAKIFCGLLNKILTAFKLKNYFTFLSENSKSKINLKLNIFLKIAFYFIWEFQFLLWFRRAWDKKFHYLKLTFSFSIVKKSL